MLPMWENLWEKTMKQYNLTTLKTVTKPGKYRVAPSLYLNVARGGSKSWVQRLVVNGRRRDIGLGSFRKVSLREARGACF